MNDVRHVLTVYSFLGQVFVVVAAVSDLGCGFAAGHVNIYFFSVKPLDLNASSMFLTSVYKYGVS